MGVWSWAFQCKDDEKTLVFNLVIDYWLTLDKFDGISEVERIMSLCFMLKIKRGTWNILFLFFLNLWNISCLKNLLNSSWTSLILFGYFSKTFSLQALIQLNPNILTYLSTFWLNIYRQANHFHTSPASPSIQNKNAWHWDYETFVIRNETNKLIIWLNYKGVFGVYKLENVIWYYKNNTIITVTMWWKEP